jgi:hypothetical protein
MESLDRSRERGFKAVGRRGGQCGKRCLEAGRSSRRYLGKHRFTLRGEDEFSFAAIDGPLGTPNETRGDELLHHLARRGAGKAKVVSDGGDLAGSAYELKRGELWSGEARGVQEGQSAARIVTMHLRKEVRDQAAKGFAVAGF